MEITRITIRTIQTRREYGHISEHQIVRVHTDEGLTGLGEMSDYQLPELPMVEHTLNELLCGRVTSEIAPINQLLRTHDFQASVAPFRVAASIDLALCDLQGKALGVPVYELYGGKFRDRMKVCYPIFGSGTIEDFEANIGRVKRVLDLGHDLVRYYVSGDMELDYRFLQAVRERFEGRVGFKSFDMASKFKEWETAMRYYDRLRPLEPIHVEGPSKNLDVCAEFTRRADLPVSMHVFNLEGAFSMVEKRACDAFNVQIYGGPTYSLGLMALAEAAGVDVLIGTDQEASIGTAGAAHMAAAAPRLPFPGDPVGPVLYATDVVKKRPRYEQGFLLVPEGPGLGMELDEEWALN